MRLSDNAEKVLKARYYLKNEKGEIVEDFKSLCKRVCNATAQAEEKENGNVDKWSNAFFEMMYDLDFLPNSPTLFNAGKEKGLLSACFTLDVEDNMVSIMKALSDAAFIFKGGGGVGLSFNSLRPEGELIKTTGGQSCLTGDTILYNIRPKKTVDRQEITIDQLYYLKEKHKAFPQKIKCIVDQWTLGTNSIVDVIYNGKAPVFEIRTFNGYKIKATANHRFLNKYREWQEVSKFKVGELIAVNGKPKEVGICSRCGRELPLRGKNSKYKGLCENCVVSVFHGCSINGSDEHKRKIEIQSKKWSIHLNKPKIKEQRRLKNLGVLNPGWRGDSALETTARQRIRHWYPDLDLSKCTECGSDKRIEIHHIDINPYNNNIDNLKVLCCSCHNNEHSKIRYKNNPRLMKEIDFDNIISIKELPATDVYDIAMAKPYHNFIANGFISHNSGPCSFMRMFDTMTEVVKQGGCIAYDSIIRTSNGLATIESLLDCPPLGENQIKDFVFTDNGFKPAKIAKDNSLAKCYNIRTQIGTEINATEDHAISVLGKNGDFEWKKAKDISREDFIVHVLGGEVNKPLALGVFPISTHFNSKKIIYPKVMTTEFAELIGLYMADGCLSTNGRIIFAVNLKDKDLIKRILFLMKKVFDLKTYHIQKKKNDNSICIIYNSIECHKYFHWLGISKNGALNSFVPNVILRSDYCCACSFVRGIFEGDGTIHEDGYPIFNSISPILVNGLQQLLFSLGIVSHKSVRERTGNSYGINDIWTLSIIQFNSIKNYIDSIGFISKRKNNLLQTRFHKPLFEQNDIIPNQESILEKLYNSIPNKPFKFGKYQLSYKRKLYRKLQHFLPTVGKVTHRNLTRRALLEILHEYPEMINDHFKKIADYKYFYSRVESIGTRQLLTMDIEVPDTSNFIANGMLIHNKRRGALLGLLNVEHPDIEKFITSKAQEGNLANFNISVGISDEFMYKVKAKEPKELNIWNKIVEGAYNNGEPGVLFMTTINNTNPLMHIGRIKSSNPCLTGDTLINTTEGWRRIDSFTKYEQPLLISDESTSLGEEVNKCTKVWKSGNKEVFRISTVQGFSIKATKEHRFLTPTGWKEVQQLGIGDQLIIQSSVGDFNEDAVKSFREGWLTGSLVGDGCVHKGKVVLDYYDKSELKYAINILKEEYGQDVSILKLPRNGTRLNNSRFARAILNYGITSSENKKSTDFVFKSNEGFVRGYLSGLFTADGSIFGTSTNSGVTINLSQSDLPFLRNIQLLLLNLGIYSKVYEESRPEQLRMLPDSNRKPKEYFCKSQHVLCITGYKNLVLFRDFIGFGGNKQEKLTKLLKEFSKPPYKLNRLATISRIDSVGNQDVYDLSEPKTHAFIANGFISHNCGEYLAIPYSSCNLGSINLSNMYKDAEINWDKLEKTVRTSVRFLDNIITINWYPLPEIRDITLRTRPIGLGVMGFADLLLKLETRYDSSEAIDYAQEIMEFIKEKAYDESVKLGKEKGSFPEFKKTKLPDKYETLRNCMVTVIAPTGSLSLIAGCSSGIEPNFSWHTEMHRIDTVMEEYHPLAIKFLKNSEPLPNYFVTAAEISPEWHIRMQAAFQVFTDSAISKTCNMPNSATKEDVAKAYMLAWELKTKGVTIYREGSRSKEVLTKSGRLSDKKNQKLLNLVYRDRDTDLAGKTRKAKTGCGNSYITVNFDETGYPIEVFKQVSSKGGCDAMAEGLARMTSLALRYGIDITEIIKQLRSVKCSNAISKNVGCLSCPDLMGRVLSDLIHKQSAENLDVKCPDCGYELETLEGCIRCKKCGWSRCS